MNPIQVVNRTRGTVLGAQVRIADRFWPRLRGLLFRPEPGAGEGLLLSPCQGIHTFGMRYALDVAFLDEQGVVVATRPGLRPWQWSGIHGAAAHALELPVGTLAATGTEAGDRLSWGSATGEPAATGSDGRGTSRREAPKKETRPA